MNSDTLLVELLTEELPPKALLRLAKAFAEGILAGLHDAQLISGNAVMQHYATPRRLAVSIEAVLDRSPDRALREKILPASVAIDSKGLATAPLEKKLSGMGLSHLRLEDLERAPDGKQEFLFYNRVAPGRPLAEILDGVVSSTLAALPIPKVMNYQRRTATGADTTIRFVRPAHRLVALHGSQIVAIRALGLDAGRLTAGHRFLCDGAISLATADSYANTLHESGRVIASFEERRSVIRESLLREAGQDLVVLPDSLVDEVTGLVEWPVVYAGQFDERFLEVPQECLILTMQQNQKYFALTDDTGRMRNRFLLVSNLAAEDPSALINGNERVLRARLSDAKFFYDQDRNASLASRLPRFSKVVYHNLLGTQLARVERIVELAGRIAQKLACDVAKARRGAQLCKADLLTEMVGEFPELQGIMGQYYALHDGEDREVAQAIEEHYRPRFAGDALPRTQTGAVVALADKLETLVGMFRIGNIPTGDRDPFALRRHALGILRILIELDLRLELPWLIETAWSIQGQDTPSVGSPAHLLEFFYDRLRSLLKDIGYATVEVESVVSLSPARIDLVPRCLAAIRAFLALPESAALAAANKRVGNILKKAGDKYVPLDTALMTEPAEKILASALASIAPHVEARFAAQDYQGMLESLAALRAPVDTFFEEVMVMAPDLRQRANRIALLRQLHDLMNRIADISMLAGS